MHGLVQNWPWRTCARDRGQARGHGPLTQSMQPKCSVSCGACVRVVVLLLRVVVGIAWMGCSSVCVFLPDLLVYFSAVLMYCRQHAREMTMDFAGSNAAYLYCASLWCVCVLCACSFELVAARCRFVRHMYLCLTSIISVFDRKLLLLSCESDRV